MNDPQQILRGAYPNELVDALVDAFVTIEANYRVGKWKASELDGGHFVEAARRIVEQELFAKYTPIGKRLPSFSAAELTRYENATGPEEFRILVPRVLWSLYTIRNKRGIAHLSSVSANEIDASYILSAAKWVMAELVRIKSGLTAVETHRIMHRLSHRNVPDTWLVNGKRRLLRKMQARDEILVHLFEESPQDSEELRSAVEYSHKTRFRRILRKLHNERLIEYSGDESCTLSPRGEMEAEKLLLSE